MNKADKLKSAMKRKPAANSAPAPKPSAEAVEKFASGAKAGGDNAKVTIHFNHEVDQRLRRYFGGLPSPRGTLSALVEAMVTEGLDKRGG